MEKDFTPYEQALALKEFEFDEPCIGRYDSLKVLVTISRPNSNSYYKGSVPSFLAAPLYQQAFRWFREKYNLDKVIDNWAEQSVNGEIWSKAYQYYINGEAYTSYYKTYEEAELECLKKLIEIVKQK